METKNQTKTEAGADSPVKISIPLDANQFIEIRTPNGNIYIDGKGSVVRSCWSGILKIWPDFGDTPLYSPVRDEELTGRGKAVITIGGEA